MAVTWNGDARFHETQKQIAQKLQYAAVQFFNQHTQRLGVPYPPASKRGEYPHKRTGFGQANVRYAPADAQAIIAAGLKVRIGIAENAWYMLHLEKAKGRLGFNRTLQDLRPVIAAILSS